jgi:ferredoxin
VALQIEVDREKCMGSGHCTFEAPGVFELDEDGISTVVSPSASSEDRVMAAAKKCPTQAIAVRREHPNPD